jgi:hypothetical protein
MALQRQSSYWFVAAALLGLAAGLRPTLVILLIPLRLWTAISLHLNRKTAVAVKHSDSKPISEGAPFINVDSKKRQNAKIDLSANSRHTSGAHAITAPEAAL